MKLIALVLFPLLVNINGESSEELGNGNKLIEILSKLRGKITHDYVPSVAADWNDADIDTTDEDLGDSIVRMIDDSTSKPDDLPSLRSLIAHVKPILGKLVDSVAGTNWEEVGHAAVTIFDAIERQMIPAE